MVRSMGVRSPKVAGVEGCPEDGPLLTCFLLLASYFWFLASCIVHQRYRFDTGVKGHGC